MTAIRQILQANSPMPLGEFLAQACKCVPAEATGYGKRPRAKVVSTWIWHYRSKIRIVNEIIEWAPNVSKPKPTGTQMLDALKATGVMTFQQSGLANSRTYETYIKRLRRHGWVTLHDDGSATWCGPPDATMRKSRQRASKKQQANGEAATEQAKPQ